MSKKRYIARGVCRSTTLPSVTHLLNAPLAGTSAACNAVFAALFSVNGTGMCVALSEAVGSVMLDKETAMNTEKNSSSPFLTSIMIGTLASFFAAACGGVDDGAASTESADSLGTSVEAQALRMRRARHVVSARGTGETAAPAANSASVGSVVTGNSSAAATIDPVTGVFIPAPRDPNIDPNSGVNYNELSNVAVDSGGQCANNRKMTGACQSYGVQCVFDADNETHYCTCLISNSLGIQGWECR